jgi:hypothetical protein
MADHHYVSAAWDTTQDVFGAMALIARDEGVRDQIGFIVRAALIGMIGWGSLALIDARSELAVLKVQHIDFERRLAVHDQRITTGTDDRWRRRDHDAYAEGVTKRVDDLSDRVDAQGKNINELMRRIPK